MGQVRIFLSTVSAEFRSYRDALRPDFERPNVTLKVQEDFIATGTETLEKLDDYLRECDAVVHLVGDMTGAPAQPPSLKAIRQRYPDLAERLPALATCLQPGAPALSYTQWEAWLALYHRKVLIVAVPEQGAPRDPGHLRDPDQQAAQQAHLARLAGAGRYPEIRFANPDRLAVGLWRSRLVDILVAAGIVARPANLPFLSIGELFMGREGELERLARDLGPVIESAAAPAVARVVHGLGGVGKTRLALEYAWRHGRDYSARLFVGADGPEALRRNLAALCGPAVLDLPEQAETDENRQVHAVLGWLRAHPGWLLILDNVDAEDAAREVEALLPRLAGGHLLLTSRLSQWSAGVVAAPLEELPPEAARDFLLARTEARRRRHPDDPAAAQKLAAELGRLALALEQAGAYIAQRRLSLASYLEEWQRRREQVLQWFDPRLMQYPASVAVTWQTSFDRLSEPARRLLQRLAWLAPEPIPESLLEVAVPGDEGSDAIGSLSELEAYSLVSRADDAASFTVHRLVQEVSRLSQRSDPAGTVLGEALAWVDEAFVGKPVDVRDWPVLEPLAAHAQAVATLADEAKIVVPTSRLLNQVALLLLEKAQFDEAEPLMRRAMAIDETSYGAEHPTVAIRLNNLAQLLKDTNRLGEAEPLMRRALAIDEASYGAEHPKVADRLSNLAQLLQDTNRAVEAEPLLRRALAIDQSSYGAEHPAVARDFNNLAQLLKTTNRLGEAEPLIRRALAIDEVSYGAGHPKVATDLNNLALLLRDTNRMSEAELLMRRALAIDEASYGAGHPKVATDLNNLALVLQDTNRLAEAEPLTCRALAIDEASYGTEHPRVATSLNNLGALLQATDRPGEAEPLMRRALAILIVSLGVENPKSKVVKDNYVELLAAMGRTEVEQQGAIDALVESARQDVDS